MQVESRSYDRRIIFVMPLSSACFAQLSYARMAKQGWGEENNTFFLLWAGKHASLVHKFFPFIYIYIGFSTPEPVGLNTMARNDPSAEWYLDAYTNCRNYWIRSLGIAGLEPATFKLKAYCSTNWAIHPEILDYDNFNSLIGQQIREKQFWPKMRAMNRTYSDSSTA